MIKFYRSSIFAFAAGLMVAAPTLSHAMGAVLAARAASVSASSASVGTSASAAARASLGARALSSRTVIGAGTVGVLSGFSASQTLGVDGAMSPTLERLLSDVLIAQPYVLESLRSQAIQNGDMAKAAMLGHLIERAKLERAAQDGVGALTMLPITRNPHYVLKDVTWTVERPTATQNAPTRIKVERARTPRAARGLADPRRARESLSMVRRGQGFTAAFVESCAQNDTALAFVSRYVDQAARSLSRTAARASFGADDLAQSFWLTFEALCASFEARSDAETMGLVKTVLRNNLYALIKADGRQVLSVQKERDTVTVVPSGEGTRKTGAQPLAPQAVAAVQSGLTDEVLNRLDVTRMAQGLSPDQRRALALRMAGFSLDEAGQAMGVPQTRVKQLLREARIKARRYLDLADG